ncbi:MAG: lysophospholipid acyltransferase family protein [Ruminococcus sp.]|jgi:1-acyl-sn-glycerol-3-phosphate acyltransferase
MLRLIIILIIVIVYLILSIPLMLIEWILGKFNSYARDISSLRIIQAIFKLILLVAGVKTTVIGEENIPKDQAVLYVANHRGFFDIIITYSRCPRLTGYVAKKEMIKVPLLNVWMMYLHCLFLNRKDIKEGLKTILTGIEKIKQGISIFIFPEGTRNKNKACEELLPFHEGSFKLATKTGCPIIPVSINNTASIFEDHFPTVKPAHVILEYGKPILPSQLSKEELRHIGTYTQNIISETLKKNASLV